MARTHYSQARKALLYHDSYKPPPAHNCIFAASQHQRVALLLHSNTMPQLLTGVGDADVGSSDRSIMVAPVACATIQ